MEIRDSRGKEWFWLDNEYLNGYAKHLGVTCTSVYISLCRHSDNTTQTCFPSMEKIGEELGLKRQAVSRAIKKLQDWGIISVVTKYNKESKKRENNIYTLMAKKSWKDKPCTNKEHGKPCTPTDQSHVLERNSNKTHINKTHIVAIATEQTLKKEFNNKEAVTNLLKDEARDVKILGYYFLRKGIMFSSQKELSQAIAVNRSMINAFTKKNGMHPFENIPSEKILKAMDYAKEKFPDWSLKVIMERCYEIGK